MFFNNFLNISASATHYNLISIVYVCHIIYLQVDIEFRLFYKNFRLLFLGMKIISTNMIKSWNNATNQIYTENLIICMMHF